MNKEEAFEVANRNASTNEVDQKVNDVINSYNENRENGMSQQEAFEAANEKHKDNINDKAESTNDKAELDLGAINSYNDMSKASNEASNKVNEQSAEKAESKEVGR